MLLANDTISHDQPLAAVARARIEIPSARFGSQWAYRAPSTGNVSLDAVRSATAYWQRQGWLGADFTRIKRGWTYIGTGSHVKAVRVGQLGCPVDDPLTDTDTGRRAWQGTGKKRVTRG